MSFKDEQLVLPPWPGGRRVAVSLTFDVDAEAALLGTGVDESSNFSRVSERIFGVRRGLQRILGLLADYEVRGTFYVPGYTAQKYPEEICAISEAGHDIGHHGYLHRPPNRLDETAQRDELQRGYEVLQQVTGISPRGYRSPSWEVTPYTFRMLSTMGFVFDSSCMGDDRPYLESVDGVSILELPVHWSLDDWAYYSWSGNGSGLLSDPAMVSAIWVAEYRQAAEEGGHVTYTAHPEVSGRRSRFRALRALVEEIHRSGDAWFATHLEVAELVTEANQPVPKRVS